MTKRSSSVGARAFAVPLVPAILAPVLPLMALGSWEERQPQGRQAGETAPSIARLTLIAVVAIVTAWIWMGRIDRALSGGLRGALERFGSGLPAVRGGGRRPVAELAPIPLAINKPADSPRRVGGVPKPKGEKAHGRDSR